ncbi:hypothetical protein M5K25_027354 [Dendrobium thyrsiflorum]|uniref:Uncharacterized protein n=1 Tax=Dendrobium thyrsiflorum TaxID=117978 RepID=A0ABD0TZS3_DENTH
MSGLQVVVRQNVGPSDGGSAECRAFRWWSDRTSGLQKCRNSVFFDSLDSNHNLDYQTVSKLDKLIVESSGSTRRPSNSASEGKRDYLATAPCFPGSWSRVFIFIRLNISILPYLKPFTLCLSLELFQVVQCRLPFLLVPPPSPFQPAKSFLKTNNVSK